MSERVVTVGGNKATRPIADFSVSLATEYYVGPNATGAGDDGRAGKSKETSLATLEAAIALAVAQTSDKNDIIYLLPGHTETIATAGAISLDKIGLRVVGLGTGAYRPTFTFSAVDATLTITAASCGLENVIIVPSIDAVVSPIVVSAADCKVDVEIQDATALIECESGILTTAAAERIDINLKYRGFIAGDACVTPIKLVGVDTGRIYVDFYGVASTAIVEFSGTACHDIDIKGLFYNDGTSLTKNVVDSATGSTWSCQGWDGNSNANFSGGDNAALATDDVTEVITELAKVPKSDSNVTFNATALQSIQDEAEDALEGEDLDHFMKLDDAAQPYPVNAAADSVVAKMLCKGDPATPSSYSCVTDSQEMISDKLGAYSGDGGANLDDSVKAALDLIEAQTDDIGTAGAGLTDLGGMSTGMLAEVEAECTDAIEADDLDHLLMLDDAGQNYPVNCANDSVIAKMIAKGATATPSTYDNVTDSQEMLSDKIGAFSGDGGAASDDSIKALLDLMYSINERGFASATAVMVDGDTLFTIAGGPIQVEAIVSVCVSGNNATASTLQYSQNPTDGAATTFSGASASLADALAGASVVLQGTTLATAPTLNASGAAINASGGISIILQAGIVTAVIGVGSTTGTWKHYIRYKPLASGVTVS